MRCPHRFHPAQARTKHKHIHSGQQGLRVRGFGGHIKLTQLSTCRNEHTLRILGVGGCEHGAPVVTSSSLPMGWPGQPGHTQAATQGARERNNFTHTPAHDFARRQSEPYHKPNKNPQTSDPASSTTVAACAWCWSLLQLWAS